ncbi:MAG: PTS transporter subunit EIIC [Thomasclavelia ramosa]
MDISLPYSYELEYEYPLLTKISKWMVKKTNEELDTHLPKGEVTSITMHFINALEGTNTKMHAGNIENKISKVIFNVTNIVEKHFNFNIDKKSFNYFRFKNHLKYFVQRKEAREMFTDNNRELYESMIEKYPDTYDCISKIDNYFYQEYKEKCTTEELLYLLVHVNRLYIKRIVTERASPQKSNTLMGFYLLITLFGAQDNVLYIKRRRKMAKKYEKLAKTILDSIGGKENITYFQHCTTRLRFNLKDRSIVKISDIENVDQVLGSQWSNDELQIIIGPAVADAYAEICEFGNLQREEAIDEDLDGNAEKKKVALKSVLMGIMDGISGCITPIIPMMIGGGMIKVFYMLANMVGILPETSSTYQILYWLGDAFIYFFPVFLGATAAKKFGANQGVGMLLGALLIYPSFIAMATEGAAMSIFGLPVYVANYSTTVIPIILTVYILSKVEKLINRYCPDILKSFVVPTGSLLVMLPIMLVVTAPLGYYIGTYVAEAVIWIYETIGFLGVSILCALLPLMVMTGMHTMMTPYWTSAFASLGYDPFFLPAMILSNMNQFAATLAVSLKAKTKKVKSTAMSCAVTAIVGGVTEPAMFGITFKYKNHCMQR